MGICLEDPLRWTACLHGKAAMCCMFILEVFTSTLRIADFTLRIAHSHCTFVFCASTCILCIMLIGHCHHQVTITPTPIRGVWMVRCSTPVLLWAGCVVFGPWSVGGCFRFPLLACALCLLFIFCSVCRLIKIIHPIHPRGVLYERPFGVWPQTLNHSALYVCWIERNKSTPECECVCKINPEQW